MAGNDLTEASLLDLMRELRRPYLASHPLKLIISAEGLDYARDLAKRDPEFARRVREAFPDLADQLLGTPT